MEVTTLVIPGVNDDPSEIRDVAQFIAGELGRDVPWHISRFFPAYKMTDKSPTPVSTMQRAFEIGMEEGLHYIYMGNVAGESNTFCHNCGKLLIRRQGYWVSENLLQKGCCPECQTSISGVWSDSNVNQNL